MNKQEFLGASLRNGLKCICSGEYTEESEGLDNQIPFVFEIVGMNDEWVDVIGRLKTITENQMIVDCFPIARPLSDLTKPITHNGETFVPIVELAKIGDTTYDKLIISNLKFDYRFVNLDYLPVWMYRRLIEWHFNLMSESEPFIPVTNQFNPYK